jgi:hypothetical protein
MPPQPVRFHRLSVRQSPRWAAAFSGGPTDVWIFQVAGTLIQASATHVTLAGGALPQNIFWQVAGAVTVGTTAHFEGVVLAKTVIAVDTGASVNGRLFAQTAVTLQQNAVNQPGSAPATTPPPPPPPTDPNHDHHNR